MNRILMVGTALALLLAVKAGAQVNVSARIDTSMMLIGDQTNFSLEATFPQGYSVSLPVFADTIIHKLEVVEAGKPDTAVSDRIVRLEQKYTVTSFDSGWYTVPQLPFAITQPDGCADTIFSAPVYFGVMTMPIDTAHANSICDIKPMQEAPFQIREIVPYLKYVLIGLLVLAVVALAVYIMVKRKRNEPIFVKVKPQEPAHVVALRQIDQLKEQKLWQRGLTKEYYTSLTDIIRIYLKGRFNIQAMESTTAEIMQMTKPLAEIDKALRNDLQDLLERADFVKFAKAQAEANENEASIEFVERFVLTTKPVEQLRDDEESGESQPSQKTE